MKFYLFNKKARQSNSLVWKKITVTILCLTICICIFKVIGCKSGKKPDNSKPNILWVVWDTVRADHLSLYGYDKPTAPFLEIWSKEARVFTNCLSVANNTVPSHASMFTGLLPAEHGLYNSENNILGNDFVTVAELLRENNYQSYLFTANPRITEKRNFTQGFDKAEYPWSKKFEKESIRIIESKLLLNEENSDFRQKILSLKKRTRLFFAAGELAQIGVEEWFTTYNKDQPFFIFLNYMDAHQPYMPLKSYRKRFMSPEQVAKSYLIDRSTAMIWSHMFGIKEYSKEEIEIIARTYDAVIAELDDLFKKLLNYLKENGHLENTIVILTSDHGEHLGEKHLLDHQYSVYEPLLRIPLIIHYPSRLEPGIDKHPVMNFDLFRTILELTGIDMPKGLESKAVSLLKPQKASQRTRLSACPEFLDGPIAKCEKSFPNFNPAQWRRTLQAVYHEKHKYIWASDGRHELYDIETDPGEMNNLVNTEIEVTKYFSKARKKLLEDLKDESGKVEQGSALSEEERKHLEALGYVGSTEK